MISATRSTLASASISVSLPFVAIVLDRAGASARRRRRGVWRPFRGGRPRAESARRRPRRRCRRLWADWSMRYRCVRCADSSSATRAARPAPCGPPRKSMAASRGRPRRASRSSKRFRLRDRTREAVHYETLCAVVRSSASIIAMTRSVGNQLAAVHVALRFETERRACVADGRAACRRSRCARGRSARAGDALAFPCRHPAVRGRRPASRSYRLMKPR